LPISLQNIIRKHLFGVFLLFTFMTSYGQRGSIFEPASTSVMDPNGDGYISETTSGFSNDGYYPDEFEIKMFGIPVLNDGEVVGDNPLWFLDCGTTDLAPDVDGFSVYAVLDENDNLIFRFRTTSDILLLEGYSILMDIDGLIGDLDPNSTPNNPGFEIGITMVKFDYLGIYVNDIDGMNSCPSPFEPDLFYEFNTNVQRSYAGTTNCETADIFYDYYVPFADLAASYGITTDTEIRFAATTNWLTTCPLNFTMDVAGVNDDEYRDCISCAFLDLSAATCPVNLDNLCVDCEGFLYGFTEKPEINQPLKAGQTFISGTSEATANIFINVYDENGILSIEAGTTADLDGAWVSDLGEILSINDSVTVHAQVPGSCTSGSTASDLSFAIVEESIPPLLEGSTDTIVYTENDDPLPIEPTALITDPDDTVLTGATIIIAENLIPAEDDLVFLDQNGISGTYVPGTGTLELSGVATIANYQSAIASISYENSSENPDTGIRKVVFEVRDTISTSNTIEVFIEVLPVNDPPEISGTPTSLQYTFGDGEVLIDDAISITDADHLMLSGATVKVSNNYSEGEDIITFSNQNGISGTFDSPEGLLTLSGSATLTDYETALASITYNNVSATPSQLTRQVSFRAYDGSDSSNIFIRFIDYSSTNNPPVIVDGNGDPLDTLYISMDEDTEIIECLDVQDPDGDQTAISSANALHGNITAQINADNSLCLDLRPVEHFFGKDILEVIVCDQGLPPLCDTLIMVVDVLPINDPPEITGNTAALTYTEGDGALMVDNSIDISDVDNASLSGAMIQLAGNYVETEDKLTFVDQNGIAGSYISTTGTYTLSGTATVEQYVSALGSITYENTSINPEVSSRFVRFRIFDGADSSNIFTREIEIVTVNLPPEIVDGDGDPLDTLYITMKEDSLINTCISAQDPDGDDVTISQGSSYNGYVSFYDETTEDLCFALLPSQNFHGMDTLDIILCDQGEPSLCDTLVLIVEVLPVNDIPVIFGNPSLLQYTEGDGEVIIDPDILTFDVDNTEISGATIQITNNYVSTEDEINFVDQSGITGSYDPGSGLLILSGSATLEEYSNALSSITYINSNLNANLATRKVDFRVFDGIDSSLVHSRSIDFISENLPPEIIDVNGDPLDTLYISTEEDTPIDVCIEVDDPDGDEVYISSFTPISDGINAGLTPVGTLCFNLDPFPDHTGTDIFQVNICDQGIPSQCDTLIIYFEVTPVNDAPEITGNSMALEYAEGDDPTIIDTSLVIIDVDDTVIAGATVWFSTTYYPDEDLISFTDQNGITGSYNLTSGILELSGSAHINNYTDALSSITYFNSDMYPETDPRYISFRVTDGEDSSEVFIREITITNINLPPQVVDDSGNPIDTIYVSTEEDTPIEVCLDVEDPEGDDVSISDGTSNSGNVEIVIDPDDELCFEIIPDPDFHGADTVELIICDDGIPSACDTITIIVEVTPVNDPPQILFNGEPVDTIYVSTLEDTDLTACFTVEDEEDNPISISETRSITGNGVFDTDPSDDLCFIFTPNPDFNGQEVGEIIVCETITNGLCDSMIVIVDILPVNDPPVIVDEFMNPTDTLRVLVSEDSTVNLCINVIDIDGDNTELVDASQITDNGTTDLGSPGDLCFRYVPNEFFNGEDYIRVIVQDSGDPVLSDTAIVQFVVSPVNNPPDILIDGMPGDTLYLSTDEDIPLDFCFDVTDTDGDELNISNVNPIDPHGAFTETTGNGICFNYQPEENYFGLSLWEVEVCDDGDPVLCDAVIIAIDVVPVNDAPVAVSDTVTALRNHTISGNVLENDWDIDSEILIVNTTPEANPINGELTMYENGDFEYKPDERYHGIDQFTYTVCDSGDPIECAFADVIIRVDDIPITVYQAVSPNGDGMNDFLIIDGIHLFEQNSVRIYDRYNNLVWEEIGYDNDSKTWHGQSNRGMYRNKLPDDTYFYIINLGDGSPQLSGFIILKN